jgi:hypothetical protein
MIGYKPDLKSLGKRSALNAHAAFDVAGAGNTIGQIGAPVLDPTCERLGVKLPRSTRLLIYAYCQPSEISSGGFVFIIILNNLLLLQLQ